jgi:predicted HTH transcriptional regulator
LKINFVERILREVVAFANTKGGKLILGVNDDGSIMGLKYWEDDAIVFEEALGKLTKPVINYRVDTVRLSDKRRVLIYEIPEGKDKPYFLKDLKGNTIPFVRIKDKSVQASKEVIDIIKKIDSEEIPLISIGEKENQLFEYLKKNRTITVEQFQFHCDLTEEEASDILITLVIAGIIRIIPDGNGDIFVLKNSEEEVSDSYIYPLI